MMFQIVGTARDMGITVGEFIALPEDEKAIQIVYSSLIKKIEQVNEQDRADQIAQKANKHKRR